MTRLTLVDCTPPVWARKQVVPPVGTAVTLPPAVAPSSVLARFLTRHHRLPTFARTYSYHSASARAPGNLELTRTVRRLQGKFVVVNPALGLAVPAVVARQVRAAARRAGISIDTPERGATGAADWLALALYEPAASVIRHRGGGAQTAGGDVDVEFAADLHYHLVLFAGRGDSPDAARQLASRGLDAGPERGERAVPLFTLGLYTPDDDALRQMANPTAMLYKRVTGRAGAGSRDRYWHLEAWERFGEHGMLVGCVTPSQVEHARAVAAGEAWRPRPAAGPSYDDIVFGTAGGYESSRWQAFTPTFDCRAFIPPGYCLVQYTGWLSVSVVPLGL